MANLLEMLKSHPMYYKIIADEKIFVYPNIPAKKFYGAKASYLPQPLTEEDVLILVDDTLFGGAKEGFVVTSSAIYQKSSFVEGHCHPFKSMRSMEICGEFLGAKLMIDGEKIMPFSQPNKDNLIALGQVLAEYCQEFNRESSSQQYSGAASESASLYQQLSETRDFHILRTTIDIVIYFTYLATGSNTECLTLLHELCADHPDPDEMDLIINSRIHVFPRPTFTQIIQDFMSTSPDKEEKITLIGTIAGLFSNYKFDESKRSDEFKQLDQLLGMSKTEILEAVKRFGFGGGNEPEHEYTFERDSQQSSHIEWACSILEISSQRLSRDTINQAYRLKIKDYHPDKYQSLPAPIVQMLQEKAQELNQAKDILLQHI